MDEMGVEEEDNVLAYLRGLLEDRRKKGKMPKQVIAFALDMDVIADIERLRGNTPRSAFVNQILRRWLEEHNRDYL